MPCFFQSLPLVLLAQPQTTDLLEEVASFHFIPPLLFPFSLVPPQTSLLIEKGQFVKTVLSTFGSVPKDQTSGHACRGNLLTQGSLVMLWSLKGRVPLSQACTTHTLVHMHTCTHTIWLLSICSSFLIWKKTLILTDLLIFDITLYWCWRYTVSVEWGREIAS